MSELRIFLRKRRMKNCKWLLFFFCTCSLFPFSFGQAQNDIIQNRIEYISEQMESEDLDLSDITETLNYYYDHKLNLNVATVDELRSLNLLTDIQINDLLIHIKTNGKLISIYELQSLQYWDLAIIELILPFVTVNEKLQYTVFNWKEAFKYGKFEWFLRYQRTPEHKAGYDKVSMDEKIASNKYYYGNPDKYYTRIRYAYRNNLSFGFTAEKDAGEQFFKGAQKYGFDFYSLHLYYNGGKYLRTAVIGDYQVQIGQGLNFWTGYAYGKTVDIASIKKSALAIKPYTSVDETRFLRGAATVVGYRDWSLLLFGSYKKVDGKTFSDTLSEDDLGFITSINLTGMHRTTSEIAKRQSLGEIVAGGNLKYEKRNFNVGVAAVYQGYDQPYNRDIQPYNQYDFRGKQHVNLSADYNYVWRNFNVFGEVATAGYNGEYAVLQGLIMAIDSKVTLSSFYRNYSRGYSSFYNAGIGTWSSTQNEEGIYLGLDAKLSDAWTISSYYDLFRRKWLAYSADAPSFGNEFLFQLSYQPTRKLKFYARFRQRTKQQNAALSEDGTIRILEDQAQSNYRLNFTYQVTDAIQLKSKVEVVTFRAKSRDKDNGLLLQQDVIFHPKSFPLDITVRYALFNTDSYYSRIYSFENNALYTYSIPSYYYEGSRAYILLRYSFLRRFDLWVKYGQFFYSNRKTIGTGPELINGNIKSDITIQLRMKF